MTYGINKIKRLQRLSLEKNSPWQDMFGLNLQELEANWLEHLMTNGEAREENVSILLKLLKKTPRQPALRRRSWQGGASLSGWKE
jgi:hypothetical protein